MSVCKRKSDGQIFVQWKIENKLKRRYFGIGLAALTEAKAFNEEVTQTALTKVGAESPLFVELINEYMKFKKASQSEISFSNTSYKLEGPILDTLGRDIRTNKITSTMLNKYVVKRSKQNIKMTTIHRELCDIRAILNWSLKEKLISANPMAGYAMPRKDDAEVLPVSQEEIERIINNAAPHLQRAMMLSYFCGLRPGAVELLSIKYGQVNWSASSITIISAQKGGVSRREVPIHPSLPLREWFEEDGCKEDAYMITWNGRPVQSLKTAFNAAKRRAGVSSRKLPLYSLRHAFVTTLLHLDVNIHTIANISGHDVRTMLKHYAHAMGSVRVSAIGKLPEIKFTAPTRCRIGEQGKKNKVVKKK